MLSTADHVAEEIDLTGEGREGARLVASGRGKLVRQSQIMQSVPG